MADTCKVFILPKAPKHIKLYGDKVKKPESSQHVIEFPGGAIELTRLSDNSGYWCHILINRGEVIEDADGRVSARGEVVGSRLLKTTGGVEDIPGAEDAQQIAVLIRTVVAKDKDDMPL